MTNKNKIDKLEQFIVENRAAHYRLAYSYVRNKENALDIVQDSIVKALQSINRLEEDKYMKTWFYRIVVNTSIDFIRKHQRMQVMDDEIIGIHLPPSEDHLTDLDLLDAVNHLTPPYKTIIILRFFEDLKLEDIAEITGDPLNTVKTRLYAALKKLRVVAGEEIEL